MPHLLGGELRKSHCQKLLLINHYKDALLIMKFQITHHIHAFGDQVWKFILRPPQTLFKIPSNSNLINLKEEKK